MLKTGCDKFRNMIVSLTVGYIKINNVIGKSCFCNNLSNIFFIFKTNNGGLIKCKFMLWVTI